MKRVLFALVLAIVGPFIFLALRFLISLIDPYAPFYVTIIIFILIMMTMIILKKLKKIYEKIEDIEERLNKEEQK